MAFHTAYVRNIKTAGVSAVTGEGMSKLFGKIDEAALEFTECYLPDLARYPTHNNHNDFSDSFHNDSHSTYEHY
jgi:hypothetical protein